MKKQFFMTVVKNNFANKKFIILCKKVKAAHFSCVFNRAVMLFHSKLNKLRVIVSYLHTSKLKFYHNLFFLL